MMPMTPALLLPLVALASAAALPAPVPPRSAAPAPRPVVLVVHGRGQLARDTAELRRELRLALQVGTRALVGDTLVGDDDVRLVWYADALDSRAGGTAAASGCVARPARIAVDSAGAEPQVAFRLLAVLAGTLLESMEVPDDADGMELRAVAGDLRYLGDPGLRCAAEQRLDSAIARAHREGRPVVLVAHSFGALVSWGHLRDRAATDGGATIPVRRLVTVGSPLASPAVRQLVFGDASGALALPAGVGSWVNVVDVDDPFAVRLADAAGGPLPAHVRDAATETMRIGTAAAHDFAGYLRDPATVRAVTGAWCEPQGPRAPAGCARLLSR